MSLSFLTPRVALWFTQFKAFAQANTVWLTLVIATLGLLLATLSVGLQVQANTFARAASHSEKAIIQQQHRPSPLPPTDATVKVVPL